MKTKLNQQLDNLPQIIFDLPRFVKTRSDNPKAPAGANWQDPANQKLCTELDGVIGFVAATERDDSLVFIDFDHALDDGGEFVSDKAESWFNRLGGGKYYAELSQSRHGLHMFLQPTADKNNSKVFGKIYLTDDKQSFIEVFYRTNKFCLVTGDCFKCAPCTEIATGEVADAMFAELQAALETEKAKKIAKKSKPSEPAEQQEPHKRATIDSKQSSTAAPIVTTTDNAEYDQFRAEKMLDETPPAELDYNQWLAVVSSSKNIGLPYSVVDTWNRCDPERYDANANLKHWQSVNNPSFDIETLHGIAKNFGYSERDTRREWYQLRPELQTAADNRNDFNAPDFYSSDEYSADDSEPEHIDIYEAIRQQCEWRHDSKGKPTTIKSTVANFKTIFELDPNLRGLFGRDDFRQEIVFLKRAPWHNPDAQLKDAWEDSDDSELRLYLAEHYAEIGTNFTQRVFDFVIRSARENSFHSIRRFLDSLPPWDSVERADTIFIKFLGADNSEYTRAVTQHFLQGLIARALYPGCDYQSVVVLKGAQGIGKSRLLRMLGGKHGVNPDGDSWHVALRDQLDDSHAVDAMRKGWVIEIEEFAAASKTDVNALKGVLSADDVTRRFAYERRAKTVKSHWGFVATTNDDAPLRDQTGARRFLPINCHNKPLEVVDGMTPEYIRLVWAEAYAKFKAKFPTADEFDADKLRLEHSVQLQATKFAEDITQDDGLITEIKGFLQKKIPPLIIWNLLSREERRKFFVDGGRITFELEDLKARFINQHGRKVEDELRDEFVNACEPRTGVVRKFTGDTQKDETKWFVTFYGAELRQHISPAEIFSECFGSDNRKRIARISEALSQIDGWAFGERLRGADPVYFDQKRPYYRNN